MYGSYWKLTRFASEVNGHMPYYLSTKAIVC